MNKIDKVVNKLLDEDKDETVLLHFMDWNYQDKYYKAPVKLVMELADRALKGKIQDVWDWWTSNVHYDDRSKGKPIEFISGADPELDEYYFDYTDPKSTAGEMIQANKEYKELNT